MGSRTGVGLLLLVLAGCGGSDAAAPRDGTLEARNVVEVHRSETSCEPVAGPRARRFLDGERRLSALLPTGWRCRGAVNFAMDIAFADFAIPSYRRAERCPPDGLRAPAGRALLYIVEFGDWRHARSAADRGAFARVRPPARVALDAPIVRSRCFGPNRRVRWREAGRLFAAHIYLGRGVTASRRHQLAEIFDSLRFRGDCPLRCASLKAQPTTVDFNDPAHGLRVTYPARWHRARRNLAPALVDPRQVLTLSSGALGPCALRPTDVMLTLSERRYLRAYSSPRPRDLGPAQPVAAFSCPDGEDDLRQRLRTFTDRGRSFQLMAIVGRHAPARRRTALTRTLRSLRFDKPVINDDARLTAILPTGWHARGDTAFDGDVAFGSFPLDPRRPASSCRPRWVGRRPPGSAALYVVEYGLAEGPGLPASARPRRRAFQRGRPLARDALREPKGRYECPGGLSRLVRWRERGRYLQAHLFLGAHADPGRRRELAALFDSLRFRR